MFFNALGKFALGQAQAASNGVVLVAASGSCTVTGVATSFAGRLAPTAGSYPVTGVAISFTDRVTPAAGSFAMAGNAAAFKASLGALSAAYTLTGKASSFAEGELAQAGAYALTGQAPLPLNVGLTAVGGRYGVIGAIEHFVQTPAGLDALGRLALGQMSNAAPVFGASVAINAPSAAARFAVTSGANALSRSGADFDLVYGGIGHYLEAIERARELARITRKTPVPIVQPPMPPVSAPAASRPTAIDLQAVAAQQAAEQQAQAARARIARRRRQEAEILLLAS